MPGVSRLRGARLQQRQTLTTSSFARQIAGDELAEGLPAEEASRVVGRTGFLADGPLGAYRHGSPKIARQRVLDDVTNSVGETFLSHSLQCARCHDHKFDPIPSTNYYSIRRSLPPRQFSDAPRRSLQTENTSGFDEKKYLDTRRSRSNGNSKELNAKSFWPLGPRVAGRAQIARPNSNGARRAIEQTKNRRIKRGHDYEEARNCCRTPGISEGQNPARSARFTAQDLGLEPRGAQGLERLIWGVGPFRPLAFQRVRWPHAPRPESPSCAVADAEESRRGRDWKKTCSFPAATRSRRRRRSARRAVGAGRYQSQIPTDVGRPPPGACRVDRPIAKSATTREASPIASGCGHFGQALARKPQQLRLDGQAADHPNCSIGWQPRWSRRGWSLRHASADHDGERKPRRQSRHQASAPSSRAARNSNGARGVSPAPPHGRGASATAMLCISGS